MNLRKAAEMALEIIEGKWPADDEIASPVMYALREALAKPERAPIPEGWQLVPKEPTENMIKLGAYAERYSGVYGIYKAMLAAAPKPEE